MGGDKVGYVRAVFRGVADSAADRAEQTAGEQNQQLATHD